jgi:biotin carboxylase
VNEASELKEACEYALSGSITRRAEIESFIIGKEYGAESLVVNDEIYVMGIMQKWMTQPPYYAELGHAIPNDLKPEIEEKARICVRNAVKALGINFGSVNMDMIITPDGKVNIIDIGARMGGNMIGPSIIPYGTGVNYMAAMINNAVGDPIELTVHPHGAVASRLLAFNEGIVRRLPDIKETEKRFGVEIYHHLEVGMHINEYHTNLDGCGYIIAQAETGKEAIEKADNTLAYFKQALF